VENLNILIEAHPSGWSSFSLPQSYFLASSSSHLQCHGMGVGGGHALGLHLLALLEPPEVVLDEEGGVEFANGDFVVLCNSQKMPSLERSKIRKCHWTKCQFFI
jgi:hypothetical protein